MSLFKSLLEKEFVDNNQELKEELEKEYLKLVENSTIYNFDELIDSIKNEEHELKKRLNQIEDKTKFGDDIYRYKYQLQIMGSILNRLSDKDMLSEFIKEFYKEN